MSPVGLVLDDARLICANNVYYLYAATRWLRAASDRRGPIVALDVRCPLLFRGCPTTGRCAAAAGAAGWW